jgi:hypothetical protein
LAGGSPITSRKGRKKQLDQRPGQFEAHTYGALRNIAKKISGLRERSLAAAA